MLSPLFCVQNDRSSQPQRPRRGEAVAVLGEICSEYFRGVYIQVADSYAITPLSEAFQSIVLACYSNHHLTEYWPPDLNRRW